MPRHGAFPHGDVPNPALVMGVQGPLAREITRHMGGRVSITYEEHPGIPLRCFGETSYFVTGVKPAPQGSTP